MIDKTYRNKAEWVSFDGADRAWYGMERKFRYGIWKMPEWNGIEDFKNGMEGNLPSFHINFILDFVHCIYRKIHTNVQWRIQKILVGGDNKNFKHKTSKIRMSSLKLRLIFRPKSEIRTFFPPKIRWSPKTKKRSSPRLRLIFRKFKRFFRPNSGGLQKKKKKKGLHRNGD